MIVHGDCVEVMAGMEPESVDAIVTDPPYGIGFMGKSWDAPGSFVERRARPAAEGFDGVGGNHHPTSAADIAPTRLSENARAQAWHEAWAREALSVAKPGAYLLAFGGTRTVHRLACAIEDAGWIIRDTLVWAYAQGFPKSKASLKPAWEPIVMARKPGPLLELAIDACRIGVSDWDPEQHRRGTSPQPMSWGRDEARALSEPGAGRWPANVILTGTEDGRAIFDGGIGGVVGGGDARAAGLYPSDAMPTATFNASQGALYDDAGTYSRFFLLPKSDRTDREPILGIGGEAKSGERINVHPTQP